MYLYLLRTQFWRHTNCIYTVLSLALQSVVLEERRGQRTSQGYLSVSSSSLSLTFSAATDNRHGWQHPGAEVSVSHPILLLSVLAILYSSGYLNDNMNKMKMIEGSDCTKSVRITDKFRANERLVSAKSLDECMEIGELQLALYPHLFHCCINRKEVSWSI